MKSTIAITIVIFVSILSVYRYISHIPSVGGALSEVRSMPDITFTSLNNSVSSTSWLFKVVLLLSRTPIQRHVQNNFLVKCLATFVHNNIQRS